MKILQLVLSLEPGGRRVVIRILIKYLVRSGHEVHLIVLGEIPSPSDFIEELTGFGGKVLILHLPRKSILDVTIPLKISAYCRNHGIRIVHCHEAASQWVAVKTKIFSRHLKIFMSFHRSLDIENTTICDRIRNFLSGLITEKIIVCSRERRDFYFDRNWINARKISVVPNGTEVETFFKNRRSRTELARSLGFDDEMFNIGCVGHFGEEKGIDLCLRAFLSLPVDIRKNSNLIVIGAGTTERKEYLSSLLDGRTPNNVHFLGYKKNIQEYYNLFDMFLHLPRKEAFGLVIIEALASGLPIVATRVGGIPDIIVDGGGVLVNPENVIQESRQFIISLHSDDRMRKSLGKKAVEYARKKYSMEVFGEAYVNLYMKSCNQKNIVDSSISS